MTDQRHLGSILLRGYWLPPPVLCLRARLMWLRWRVRRLRSPEGEIMAMAGAQTFDAVNWL
jgi:hypothetical protein